MSNNLMIIKQEKPEPSWHDVVPLLFSTEHRILKLKTGSRRYQIGLNGLWAGIAVAWRPADRQNFGLNCEDLERLIEKIRDGALAAGFVIQALIENSVPRYIGHRTAETVHESLKDVPPRDGPHGPYWLLRGDFNELDDLAEARKRF
jgi:hypothetical protein